MPKVGNKEFPYTPEGMAAAKAESQNMGIPVNDGANRSVTEYAGGGKTGYSSIGMQKPMMYEEGGKTNPLDQDGDGKISIYERNNPPKDPDKKAKLKAKQDATKKKVKEGFKKTVKKVDKFLEDKNLKFTFKKDEKLAKKEKSAKAARAEKRAARKAARKAKREERKAYYAKERAAMKAKKDKKPATVSKVEKKKTVVSKPNKQSSFERNQKARDAKKAKAELLKKSKGISKKAKDASKIKLEMPDIKKPKIGLTIGKSKPKSRGKTSAKKDYRPSKSQQILEEQLYKMGAVSEDK